MKALLPLLFLSTCFTAQAELIWSNKSTKGDDYLVGTIHLGDERLQQLPQRIKSAVDAVDVVVLEIDLSELSPMERQQITFQHGLLPSNRGLSTELSSDVYQEAKDFLANLGQDIKSFERFKPWMFSIVMVELSNNSIGLQESRGVDKQIRDYAESRGKKIVALESFEQQMKFFDQIIDASEKITSDDVVRDTLTELKLYKNRPLEILSSWLKGDAQMFEQVYKETLTDSEFDQVAEKILLTDRNIDWQSQLDPLLKEKKVLVAVGSLHFAGPHSLLKLLEDKFIQE